MKKNLSEFWPDIWLIFIEFNLKLVFLSYINQKNRLVYSFNEFIKRDPIDPIDPLESLVLIQTDQPF